MSLQDTSPICSSLADDADMAELIQEFVACLQDRVSALALAAQDENLTEVARLAHQLKGASGGYGFDPIGLAAAQLEAVSKTAQSAAQIRDELDRLIGLCHRARAAAPTPQ